MKNEILKALAAEYYGAGQFVSGAELSTALGVTRAAISKTVQQLVASGYPIESQKHYGYRLTDLPEALNEAVISRALLAVGASTFARSSHCLATVDSTNLVARRGAEAGASDFSLYVAEEQTAGRGRRGRTWRSASGEGLWFSLLLRPDLPPEKLAPITLFAGLCVAEALRTATGLDIQLKWPNDLVVLPSGRKLGGILTETILEENQITAVVVGIGVNVHTQVFPTELNAVATSLVLELDGSNPFNPNRTSLLAQIMGRFEQRWPEFLESALPGSAQVEKSIPAWLDDYRAICASLGRMVQISGLQHAQHAQHAQNGKNAEDGTTVAEAVTISDTGDLVVRLPDGREQAITAGEVSVRGLLGYV